MPDDVRTLAKQVAAHLYIELTRTLCKCEDEPQDVLGCTKCMMEILTEDITDALTAYGDQRYQEGVQDGRAGK